MAEHAITVEWQALPEPELHDWLMALHTDLQRHPFPGYLESVPAYVSLTIFFDPFDPSMLFAMAGGNISAWVAEHISSRIAKLVAVPTDRRTISLPVCYDLEFGPDQQDVARFCGLSVEDMIRLHVSVLYRVYMIGFVPGFPYLGMTDSRLDVPRKSTPAMRVVPGSVAVAGRQTGIYPWSTPGGWQIIGRTPVRLFDPAASDPFLLTPGMDVRFERIDRSTFDKLSVE